MIRPLLMSVALVLPARAAVPTTERGADRGKEMRRAIDLIFDADVPNGDLAKIAEGVKIVQRLVAVRPDLNALRLLRQGTLFMAELGPPDQRAFWLTEYKKQIALIGVVSKEESEILDGALLAAKGPGEEVRIIERHLRRFPDSKNGPSALGSALLDARIKGEMSESDVERRVDEAVKALLATWSDRELLVAAWSNQEWTRRAHSLLRLWASADCRIDSAIERELERRGLAVEQEPGTLAEHAKQIRQTLQEHKCQLKPRSGNRK